MKRSYYISIERIRKNQACRSGTRNAESARKVLAPSSLQLPFTETTFVRAMSDATVRPKLNISWLAARIRYSTFTLPTTFQEQNKLSRLLARVHNKVFGLSYERPWTAKQALDVYKRFDNLISFREDLEEKYNTNAVTGERLHEQV